MDLEGYEVIVFKQLIPFLKYKNFRPKILFETHPEFYDDKDYYINDALEDILYKWKYKVTYVVSDFHYNEGSKRFRQMGYQDKNIYKIFKVGNRAIYRNISKDDAINLISHSEYVHAVLIEPESIESF